MRRFILYNITLVFFVLITLNLVAQRNDPYIGANMQQLMEFGPKVKLPSRFNVNGKGIIPLHISKSKALSKIVFGFMPDWEYDKGANYNMHYDLLTHVAVFNFLASSNGSLSYPSSWPWTDVINAAHTKGTKVIMAVTNFGGSEKAADVAHLLVTNTNAKNILFQNIKKVITTFKLDGVNIDFEAIHSADRGSLLNNFMNDLKDFIHTELPGKEVSFDGPAVNWGGWDIPGLVRNIDYIFIMTYDYSGSWSNYTGAVSPLTDTDGGYCVQKTILSTYGIPLVNSPQKLIMGVPYYGKQWKTVSGSAGSAITSFVKSTFYKNAVVDAANHGGFIWDNNSNTPWYKWESGGWNQVWNDNDSSLRLKYDFALTQNIGGVGIWALNYDGTRTELWNLINSEFAGNNTPLPSMPQSPAVIIKDSVSVIVKFKSGNYATNYRIFQSMDNLKYSLVKEINDTITEISGLQTDSVYYFKIASVNSAGESNKTHIMGAVPSNKKNEFLIVDGVERRTFEAITQYKYPMSRLKHAFSSASNNAVINGLVNLENFKFIIWMLLDESTNDDTFNKLEQAKIKEYIDNKKGVFIVSGSEVGWDLVEKGDTQDKLFFEKYFHARYISDAPGAANTYYTVEDNNKVLYHLDDGTHGITKIGYPDLIKPLNGSVETFIYPDINFTNGVAGVHYNKTTSSGVDYLAFPIEAVYLDRERKELLEYIFSQYESILDVKKNMLKNSIHIFPNPTYNVVKIENSGNIKIHKIELYDIYGNKLITSYRDLNINMMVFPKGLYILRITTEKGELAVYKLIKK